MQRIYEVDPPPKENAGELLLSRGLAEEAYPILQKSFKPNDYRHWSNLSACLRIMGRLNEAKEAAKTAIGLNQHSANAWHNLAFIMEDMGEFEHAREAVDVAYRFFPVNKDIAYSYAEMNMRFGDWTKFWDAWEFSREDTQWNPYPKIPLWLGQSLKGKRLLIIRQGGFGDFFWLMRYLKPLKDMNCHITYISWIKQKEFAASLCPWCDEVLSAGDTIDELKYDFQIPLMSLFILHDGPLPMSEPYVKLPVPPSNGQRLNVGLCWEADETASARKNRSIPIAELDPLGKVPVHWTDLTLAKIVPSWLQGSTQIEGWNKTSSAIARCDLVISADTSIYHLAGAMGKPVWLILPKNSHWFHGVPENSFDELWYPSVKVFYNPDLLKFDRVIQEVAACLKEKLVFDEISCKLP